MNAPEQRLLPATGADALWSEVQTAASTERLCALWLRWLQAQLPACAAAVVLLQDRQGALVATAVTPEGEDGQAFAAVVAQATGLRALSIQPCAAGHQLALPLLHRATLRGAVALLLTGPDPAAVWQAAATVRWGMGWLLAAAEDPRPAVEGRAADPAAAAQLARARLALDLNVTALSQPGFRSAALGVAGPLARAFGCQMVQVAWAEPAGARVLVRSDSAWHDARADLVRLAEQAVDEALDQGCALTVPATPATSDAAAEDVVPVSASLAPADDTLVPHRLLATAATERYRRAAATGAVLCVPLPAQGERVGALLFEREHPFSAADVDAAETLAALLGPLLLLRHQGDESLWAHLRRRSRAALAWTLGERHAGWKLLGGTFSLLLAVAAFWPVTHRVTAPSLIEGQTQRAAVAPFDGYVQSASARAGDTIRAGQVLATLDDRDLQLQQQRWSADLEVATRREREALAAADRVSLRQAAAQADSARAQLELVQERLARLAIVAPFDGVIVKGDLSQRLGSPVQTGDVLFELAPLEAWRVILKVDERDIGRVQPGQRGEIVLAGLPGQRFGLQAQRVLSVAEAEDGRNQFRVEAALDADAQRLRPGMEGVAKLDVGQASLLWVWTHRAVDWLRRTWWAWSP